jgi:pilus assembly protein Flp/PilA
VEAEMRSIKEFWNDTQGQDLMEYALAVGMVAVAAVAVMPPLSQTINTVFTKISSMVEAQVR